MKQYGKNQEVGRVLEDMRDWDELLQTLILCLICTTENFKGEYSVFSTFNFQLVCIQK